MIRARVISDERAGVVRTIFAHGRGMAIATSGTGKQDPPPGEGAQAMRLEKILVATDFGAASNDALDLARTIADGCGAALHLLHVIGDPLAAPSTLDEEQRAACARLEALLRADDRVKRRAVVSCECGTPGREIARYAGDHGIDLIVMGTHRHGSAHRMATGSIAETVIGTAPCAVLAVKPAAEIDGDKWLDPPPTATRLPA